MTICAAEKGTCVRCSVGSWVRVCMCARESACVHACSVHVCTCIVCVCVQCVSVCMCIVCAPHGNTRSEVKATVLCVACCLQGPCLSHGSTIATSPLRPGPRNSPSPEKSRKIPGKGGNIQGKPATAHAVRKNGLKCFLPKCFQCNTT